MINAMLFTDFYKVDHRRQYPEGTTEVYSNFTARYKMENAQVLPDFDDQIVVFGLQCVLQQLDFIFKEGFFKKDIRSIVDEYCYIMESSLNIPNFDCDHIVALHELGYLPIRIKAIGEGERVPLGVSFLTIVNTHPDFFWLTNYLETFISCTLWKSMTVATIAFEFKRLLRKYALKTGCPIDFIDYQAHDFSFRGLSGVSDACLVGMAHLTSFKGTDCIPSIKQIEDSYKLIKDRDICFASSVPATEHSVMTALGQDNEFATIKRLITEVYPDGVVSLVADSYNLWQFIDVYLRSLRKEINERQGKVVIRPDSGDPITIVCGDFNAPDGTPECKGVLRMLWEIFGGHVNSQGYKVLDSHIGVIYGDAITLERATRILETMRCMGFCSSNIVFGIGSFTYQYLTRDTFGFAMKATSIVINGERRAIFKQPATGKSKNSARGLLKVDFDNASELYTLQEDVSEEEEREGALLTVYEDGKFRNMTTFKDIKAILEAELLALE